MMSSPKAVTSVCNSQMMNNIAVVFTHCDNEKLIYSGVQCFIYSSSLQAGQIQTQLLQTLMYLHTFAAIEVAL